MESSLRPLIIYTHPYQHAYGYKIIKLIREARLPFKTCTDLSLQLQKNIFRVPVVELPNGELLTFDQVINRFSEIKSLYM